VLRGAFFDVGDTLVESWKSPEVMRALSRERLVAAFGERDWYDALLGAQLDPVLADDPARQETLRWIAEWMRTEKVSMDDLDLDRLRAVLSLPLNAVSTLVEGASEALHWCKARGLTVVLVTNTLWRGDAEVRDDWRSFGLAECVDAIASSHDVGWRKPHPAMFERALTLAGCAAHEAFMVGDRLRADVWGAKQLGIRAVWRRPRGSSPQDATDACPDATVDTLHELPRVVGPWLDGTR
jgi:FMN phosphatase YigB (HAD superfamily)